MLGGKTFAATRSKCLLVFNCGESDSAGIEGCDKSWFPVSCREARSRFGRVVNSHGRPTLPDHNLTLTGDIDENLICAPCEGLFNLDRVAMLTTGALGARLLDPYLMAKIDRRAQQGPKVVMGRSALRRCSQVASTTSESIFECSLASRSSLKIKNS